MKGNLAILGALVVVIGVAVALVALEPSDPSGHATGVTKSKLWQDLGEHGDTFLGNWADAFENHTPEAMDVAEAWSELAYAVGGRSGFWRSQVRKEWFGCGSSPVADDDEEDDEDSEVDPCSQLDKIDKELGEWDGMLQQVSSLSHRAAARFLRKNEKRMRQFVKRFVPPEASASGMKQTPVYKEYLASTGF